MAKQPSRDQDSATALENPTTTPATTASSTEAVGMGLPGFRSTKTRVPPVRDDLNGHPLAGVAGSGPVDDEEPPAPRRETWDPGKTQDGYEAQGDAGPSPASTDSGGPDLWAGVIGGLAGMAAAKVHNRRTPYPDGNTVWIASDDELQAVGECAGRIINRHTPAGLKPDSDVGDALVAVMVVGGYALRNTMAEAQLRRGGAPIIDTQATAAPAPPEARPAGPPPGADGATVVSLLGATPPGMGPFSA